MRLTNIGNIRQIVDHRYVGQQKTTDSRRLTVVDSRSRYLEVDSRRLTVNNTLRKDIPLHYGQAYVDNES